MLIMGMSKPRQRNIRGARSSCVLFVVAALLLAAPLTAVAAPAPPSYDYQREVVKRIYDGHGREILLRRGWWLGGDPGFGWDKIYHKHRITNMVLVEKIIKNPNGGEPSGGESRTYRGFAQRFSCDISGRCTEVERIKLKAVVDFRNDPNMGGQKGVITAFCEYGRPDCPSWVSNVANVPPA